MQADEACPRTRGEDEEGKTNSKMEEGKTNSNAKRREDQQQDGL